MADLLAGFDLRYLWSIVVVSLTVSVTAVTLSMLASLPVAVAVSFSDFPGKRLVTAIINTGMGFPSVVVGLIVLLALSNSGPLGDLDLIFTPEAMIISQFVLATPVVASVSLAAIEGVGGDVRDAAYALGGTRVDVGLAVLKEARYGIVTAVLAGFGRAISEVGSILIVGGNIAYSNPELSYTRSLTTAITLEARKGHYETGIALGAILLVLVLVVNALGSWVQDRGRGRASR